MYSIHSLSQQGYTPGLIGRCAAMMARFYSEKFGLGASFECETVTQMARFVTGFDPRRSGLWTVFRDDEIVGCATLDGQGGDGQSAMFRWFYLSAQARGHGLGRLLLQQALRFADDVGYARVDLTTHEDLRAAVHLYRAHGFVPTGHSQRSDAYLPIRLSHYSRTRDGSGLVATHLDATEQPA